MRDLTVHVEHTYNIPIWVWFHSHWNYIRVGIFDERLIYMKDIPGYEGLYAVTSCGRVWSHRRKIFLKQVCDKDGYMHVQLHANAKVKRFQVHRLVAQAYIKNSDNIETVDHIDGNTKNNCVNNLQWLTRTQNKMFGRWKYI